MAQSAGEFKKTPLHIDTFWEKPTVTSPLSWDKCTQQWKLALLAKEGSQLTTLINGPPSTVTHPTEPIYEEPVENHTQATERDRKVRKQQLKVNWQNRCKKIDEIGILRGDKPWELCKQKAKMLYLYSIYALEKKVVVSLRVNNLTFKSRDSPSRTFGKQWTTYSPKFVISLTTDSFYSLPNNNKVNCLRVFTDA